MPTPRTDPDDYLSSSERAFWRSQDSISALTFPEDQSYEERRADSLRNQQNDEDDREQ